MGDSERFDIYDQARNWLGTAERSEVHANGYWHQTFHCWIVQQRNEQTYLLFQRRHRGKDTYPNLLDISCAGHLEAGESIADGVRELAEELGLQVPLDELRACGIYAVENQLPNGGMDREFSHVYLYNCDLELNDYEVQLEEISGLYWIALKDVQAMAEGQLEHIPAYGLDIHDHGERSQPATALFSLHDFVPHKLDYYQLVFAQLN